MTSHVLKNVIDFMYDRDIISCFTKLSLTNNMRKINKRIENRGGSK